MAGPLEPSPDAHRPRPEPVTARQHVVVGLAGYRSALRFPDFRRLWLAAVVSRAGDALNFVALPLVVYASTGSPSAVAAVVLVEGAALIVGGAAAQLVVDRVEARRLLVGTDVARATAALALALAPGFPMALLVAAGLAVGTSWFSPTSAALVPRLVDADTLRSANALLWTAGVALQLVVAPIGGLLVADGSPRFAFGLNALSFLGSAALLTGVPRQSGLATDTSPWGQLPQAIRALPRVPMLAPLLAMQGLAGLAVGATSALLVVLAERAYGLVGTGYGVWLAAVGIGALIGPLAVPALTRWPPVTSVCGAYIVRGIGDLALGVLDNPLAGGALLFLYGMNTSSGTVAFQTLVQHAAPEALRGRSFALLDVTWQTGRLVSIALGGVLASALGIRAVFAGGGALLVVAGLFGLTTLRHARLGSVPAQNDPREVR